MRNSRFTGKHFAKTLPAVLAVLCFSALSVCFSAQEVRCEEPETQQNQQEEQTGILPGWMLDETLTLMDLSEEMKENGEGRRDDEMSNIIWEQYELFEGMQGTIAFYYMQDQVTGWAWKDEKLEDQIDILDMLGASLGAAEPKWDGLNADNYQNTWGYPLPEEYGSDRFLKFQETAVGGTHYLMLSYNPAESYDAFLKG